MKSLALTAAILIAGACPSWAQDHAAEQQVLDSGRKPADLFEGTGNPFDLEIDFTLQNRDAKPGHLSVKSQSKDHWWSKVSVGGFEQTTIRNGEMEYTVRNSGYTPEMVQELFRLLGFEVSPSKYSASNQRDRTVDGIAGTCVEIRKGEFKGNNRELCFDKASHELLREDWQVGQDEKDIETFAGYSAYEGAVYPRKLQLLKNGEESISADVTTLESAAFDPALLVPSKGAIQRRKCEGMKPPVEITRFSPTFDQPHVQGNFRAAITILADGSVGDIEVIHSGGAAMDKASLEAAKKYKFKPAMCGSDPVVADTEIEFTVRIY
jgi:TonB family protein